MAVDPQAAIFFDQQREDLDNCACCDGGQGDAVWASISHGIYLSIGAAGLHRSLGVKVSFVQSISMDSWKPTHLKMMELGGNRKFQEFLKEHRIPENMPIRQKYNTRAVEWYRKNLKALAEGLEPLAPLEPGIGHLPVESSCSPESYVLDRVFANIPAHNSTVAGGVQKVQLESSRVHPKSLCEKLSDCFIGHCFAAKADEGRDVHSDSCEDASSSDQDHLLPDVLPPTILQTQICANAK